MSNVVKVGCIKPDRVVELMENTKIEGLTFRIYKKNGLQIIFHYECDNTVDEDELDSEDVKNIVKKYLKKDPTFDGLILTVEA